MGKNRAISVFIMGWLGVVFFCATTVQGLDLYVDADAPPGGNGLSWDTAFRDIQTAIDNSVPFWIECFGPETTIMVKSGRYELTNQIEVNKTVGIYGGFPNSMANPEWDDRDWQNNETIVDGNDAVRCFRIYNMCEIDGLTITNGIGDNGGGMYIDATPTDCTGSLGSYISPSIKNCSFQDNHAIGDIGGGYGGAMYIDESDPEIQNCSFSYNTGDYAGAVYQVSSSPKYLECVFYENEATSTGGIGGAISGLGRNEVTMVNTRIINCLFYNNSADSGGAVGTSDVRPKIVNCTFWGNQADGFVVGIGGAYYGNNEGPLISNSILWGNSPNQLFINLAPDATDSVWHNDIQGGWPGDGPGNIDEDPDFLGSMDFHLAGDSPCIDTGYNCNYTNRDLDGVPRPLDGDTNGIVEIDMGCYEFGFMDLTITSIVTIPEMPSPGEEMTVEVTVINQGLHDGGTFRIDWYADQVFPPLPGESGTQCETFYSLGAGNTCTMVKTHTYDLSGMYAMYAQVDTMGQVSETDESNNVFGSQFVTVVPKADANISVKLQGSQRPDTGWIIPLTVKFFSPGGDVLADTPLAEYNLTTTKADTTALGWVFDLPVGTYDVTVFSDHTLINVKRNVVISAPITSVDMGTLLEGNGDNDYGISIGDLALFACSWLATERSEHFNAMADFDCNKFIDLFDGALLFTNWSLESPVEVP